MAGGWRHHRREWVRNNCVTRKRPNTPAAPTSTTRMTRNVHSRTPKAKGTVTSFPSRGSACSLVGSNLTVAGRVRTPKAPTLGGSDVLVPHEVRVPRARPAAAVPAQGHRPGERAQGRAGHPRREPPVLPRRSAAPAGRAPPQGRVPGPGRLLRQVVPAVVLQGGERDPGAAGEPQRLRGRAQRRGRCPQAGLPRGDLPGGDPLAERQPVPGQDGRGPDGPGGAGPGDPRGHRGDVRGPAVRPEDA